MITEHEREYNRKYMKRWRKNNLEKAREQDRKRYANNPEKERIESRNWRNNHLEYCKELKAKYYFSSLERYQEVMLKYDGECAFACDKKAGLVHHMDGKSVRNSSQKKIDNSLNNLLPLCKPCHSRLHKPAKKRKR